jgi:hypothetical protein
VDFEAARPLTSNDELGVRVAELDLPNRQAAGVNLPQDDRRAGSLDRKATTSRAVVSPTKI